jgi:glycosyltransferase involved in cell wall biosynthesis
MMLELSARNRYRKRRDVHDVVFYTPWVGSILSDGESLPPGGAETQVLLLAKALVRCGLRIAIISYGSRDELPRKVDGVTVIARPPYRKRRWPTGKFAETVQTWRALWRAPSQVIVKRGAGIDLGLIAVYARLARRRLVFSSANVVDFEYHKLMPKPLDLFIYKLGVRLANTIVVQTEEQLPLCSTAFGRRATVIKSIAQNSERQRDTPEAFLWVGRLVSYKRPLEYIALARALPEAHFWMVGVPTPSSREDEQLVRDVIAAADELANLELLCPRSRAGIAELMSRAVASVNTADFEGMPNVLLEAWSMGVPALVLNHDPGGVITAHGIGGFARGSRETFVALALEQWESRTDRASVSERCHDYIAGCHDAGVIAALWCDALAVTSRSNEMPTPTREMEATCVG